MRFCIIEELGHPARGRVALWLGFKAHTSEFMVAGGEVIEVEQYREAHFLDPRAVPSLEREMEGYQSELTYLEYVNRGAFGYVKQMEGADQRTARIKKLENLRHETRVEITRCREMQWLTEPGAIFAGEQAEERKARWLQAVRTEPRPLMGDQLNIFHENQKRV